MTTNPRGRRGMALFIVLMVAFLLLIASLALWQANQAESATIPNQVRRMQAEFLAKGALQLALLKSRILYTPLYHASSLSVGKNPFFEHSEGYAHLDGAPISGDVVAPGPAFLTGTVDLTDGKLKRFDVKTILGGPGPASGSDWDGDGTLDFIVDQHLLFFGLDLADRTWSTTVNLGDGAGGSVAAVVEGQPMVGLNDGEDCPMFGGPDPYAGRFRIRSIQVMGGMQGRQYREDALVVVADAEVTATIAGIRETWKQEERTVYKALRRHVILAPAGP